MLGRVVLAESGRDLAPISVSQAGRARRAHASGAEPRPPRPTSAPGGRQERASIAPSVAPHAAGPSSPRCGSSLLASSSCRTLKRCTSRWYCLWRMEEARQGSFYGTGEVGGEGALAGPLRALRHTRVWPRCCLGLDQRVPRRAARGPMSSSNAHGCAWLGMHGRAAPSALRRSLLPLAPAHCYSPEEPHAIRHGQQLVDAVPLCRQLVHIPPLGEKGAAAVCRADVLRGRRRPTSQSEGGRAQAGRKRLRCARPVAACMPRGPRACARGQARPRPRAVGGRAPHLHPRLSRDADAYESVPGRHALARPAQRRLHVPEPVVVLGQRAARVERDEREALLDVCVCHSFLRPPIRQVVCYVADLLYQLCEPRHRLVGWRCEGRRARQRGGARGA